MIHDAACERGPWTPERGASCACGALCRCAERALAELTTTLEAVERELETRTQQWDEARAEIDKLASTVLALEEEQGRLHRVLKDARRVLARAEVSLRFYRKECTTFDAHLALFHDVQNTRQACDAAIAAGPLESERHRPKAPIRSTTEVDALTARALLPTREEIAKLIYERMVSTWPGNDVAKSSGSWGPCLSVADALLRDLAARLGG